MSLKTKIFLDKVQIFCVILTSIIIEGFIIISILVAKEQQDHAWVIVLFTLMGIGYVPPTIKHIGLLLDNIHQENETLKKYEK